MHPQLQSARETQVQGESGSAHSALIASDCFCVPAEGVIAERLFEMLLMQRAPQRSGDFSSTSSRKQLDNKIGILDFEFLRLHWSCKPLMEEKSGTQEFIPALGSESLLFSYFHYN